jgi:hypothetical protein
MISAAYKIPVSGILLGKHQSDKRLLGSRPGQDVVTLAVWVTAVLIV